MELNIIRLRLVGLVSFGLFLTICLLSLTTTENSPAGKWGSNAEKVLITVSVCSFLSIFLIQTWVLIRTYYLKKEDTDTED